MSLTDEQVEAFKKGRAAAAAEIADWLETRVASWILGRSPSRELLEEFFPKAADSIRDAFVPGRSEQPCLACGMRRGFHGPLLAAPGDPQCSGFVEASQPLPAQEHGSVEYLEPADSCYVPEDEFHDAIGQSPLAAAEAEIERLKTAKADAIAVLEGLLEANRNRVDELENELNEGAETANRLSDQVDALKAKLRRSKAKRAKLKRQRDEARAERDEIAGDYMAREKGMVARAEERAAEQIAAWIDHERATTPHDFHMASSSAQAHRTLARRIREGLWRPPHYVPEAPEAPASAAEGGAL